MTIETISTVLQAAAVIFAVAFGVVQVRQFRAQRRLQARLGASGTRGSARSVN